MWLHLTHVLFFTGLEGAGLTLISALCLFKAKEKNRLEFSLYAESHTASNTLQFSSPLWTHYVWSFCVIFKNNRKIYPRNYFRWKKAFYCPRTFQWRGKNERPSTLLPHKPGWGICGSVLDKKLPIPMFELDTAVLWRLRVKTWMWQSGAWGETQTLDWGHLKEAGQIANMIQGGSLGWWLLWCVSCDFCCCRSKGEKKAWFRIFLLLKTKCDDGTPEKHALVKGCSGANVGCSPGRGLEETGFIWGRKI